MDHFKRFAVQGSATQSSHETKRVKTPGLASVLMMLTLFCVSGCGTLTQQLEQEDAASAEATTQIKARLVEAESVDSAAVRVELKDDVIVLSGFVASEDEASEVVSIAEEEAGQYTVKNDLVVKQ